MMKIDPEDAIPQAEGGVSVCRVVEVEIPARISMLDAETMMQEVLLKVRVGAS